MTLRGDASVSRQNAVGSRQPNRLLLTACCLLITVHGALLAAGCAPVLLATAGAVAGYAVGRDSVTLDLDRPSNKVWAACLEEVKFQGRLKKEDRANGRLEAQIREVDVVVTLEQLTPSTVRVVIRARKNLLPKVETAQRLSLGIARRVG